MGFFDGLTGAVDDSSFNKAMGNVADPNSGNYTLGNAGQMNATAQGLSNQKLNQRGLNSAVGDQNQAYNLMLNQAQGKGPSVADAQMNQGVAQAANNAMSMAAANRGGGGLALRDAMQAGASAAGQAAGSGAIARAQEQMGALSQLGSQTGQMANTQLGAQQNVLGQQSANTAGLNAQLGINQSQLAANMAEDQARMQQGDIRGQLQQQQNMNNAHGFSNALGNIGKIGQAIGGIAGSVMGLPGGLAK